MLVGRGAERAALHGAVDRAADGVPSLTCVAGEAGVGKSRLVGELGRGASARGVRVLSGACAGLEGCEIPYGPLVAALRGAAGDGLTAAFGELSPQMRDELTRALPELLPGAPSVAAGEPAGSAQARLFESLLELVGRLSAEATTLLVLEDLHWADPSTRDFVRFFCARARTERVAVVATFRTDELDRRHPLRALLAELTRSPRVSRVELGRLTRAEVAVQLAEILDAEPGAALVDEIFGRSEGNPFYAEELLAMARAGAGTGAELPASLRDALLVRIDGLSGPARSVLAAAAVVGRPVDHGLLAASAGVPRGRLAGLLREAVGAHVLTPDGDRLRFRHALVREAVYADLLAVERADLHRRVATALAATVEPNPADLAHHWQAAGEPGPAMSACVDAGLGAARSYSFRDALGHFERAIELWGEAGERRGEVPFDLPGLFAEAAEAAWCVGEVDHAGELIGRALDAIDPAGDPIRAAGLHERLGLYSTSKPAFALACYARALGLLPPGPSAQRARLLGSQGLALTYVDRWEESRGHCEAAVAVARAADAPAEEARAMTTLGMALTFLGRPLDGEPMLRRSLEIAVELGRAGDAGRARINLAEVLRYRGRVADSLGVALDGERAARAAGLHPFATYLSLSAADDLFNLGRWDEAARRVDALDPDTLELTGRELWLSLSGRLAVARGDAELARSRLSAASALCEDGRPEQVPHVYGGLAELALWQGRPADAQRLVARGLDLLGTTEDALNTPILLGIGVRAEVEAGLARVAGLARAAGLAGRPLERAGAKSAGAALVARLRRITDAGDGRSCPPQARAHLLSATAELTRLAGLPTSERSDGVGAASDGAAGGSAGTAGAAERTAGGSAGTAAAADRAAGGSAGTAAAAERAAGAWERAATAWEAIEHPYPAAYARLRAAEAVSGGGGGGDVPAEGLVSWVCDQALGLGARFLLDAADRLAGGWRGPRPAAELGSRPRVGVTPPGQGRGGPPRADITLPG